MYAEIVPIVRLIRKLKYFDYKVPSEFKEHIKVGQIVEIEFRKRKVNGVIRKIKQHSETRRKEIKNILNILPIPALSKEQMDLADWMSEYYLLSPALIFKTVLPRIPKRIKEIKNEKRRKIRTDLKIKQNKKAEEIFKSKNEKNFLYHNSNKQKNEIFLDLAFKYLKKDKQIIVVLPEINNLKKFKKYLEKYFDKDLITELHSGLAKGQYFKNWLKIRKRQAKIIIGTRYSVFAPAIDLELIIIDKEHDESHKQWDQNPRYHDRDIAFKLSELTGCKILLSSSSPSIIAYYNSKKKNFGSLEIKQKKELSDIKIIDMREEFRKGNYSVFSDYLQESIYKNFSENKNIFLLINQRGSARSVICRDCGYIAKCPECDLSLTYHTNHLLICHHCGHKEKLKEKCPKCQGVRFKFVGSGTQKIETELKKIAPTAKTMRIDSDVKIDKATEQKIYSGYYQVIIGTKLALKYLDWPKLGLAAIISADVLLGIPDFRSLEKVYQLINNFHINLPASSELIIQTRNPKNYAIQAAKNNDYEKFYKKEIEQRKELGYPPFSKIVKLSFRDLDYKKSLSTAKILLRLLNNNNPYQNIAISGPFTKKIGRFYNSFFIVKIPLNLFKKSYKLFKLVPDNWTIDINPESLL